jgi:spore coat polysaccharide biosynthesis protein SpsF (cytidylyltransferase family)
MVGVFITARLGSTRLNEKHLIEVNGKPFIEWLVKRFLISFNTKIKRNDLKIFITTSTKIENNKLESIFDESEVKVFYGSDENIPLRHLECAILNNIDYIISIDGDDILCSTECSKLVIHKLLMGSRMVKTEGLPLGMNVMGYSTEFLKESLQGFENAKLETGWGKIFNKEEIDIIKLKNYINKEKVRMTLDYEADADFFKKIISNIDVLNVSDEELIEKIIANSWNEINADLEDIYWTNFNKQKNE